MVVVPISTVISRIPSGFCKDNGGSSSFSVTTCIPRITPGHLPQPVQIRHLVPFFPVRLLVVLYKLIPLFIVMIIDGCQLIPDLLFLHIKIISELLQASVVVTEFQIDKA